MASPSSQASGPARVSATLTCSPGRMLPTRMVKTSGRSCSAIAARRPAAMASSYSWRARPRSSNSATTVRPSAVRVMAVTAARSGSGKM